jgi:hypothetical protein
MLCIFTEYYFSDQTKKTEIGRAFNMYGGEEGCTEVFGGEF